MRFGIDDESDYTPGTCDITSHKRQLSDGNVKRQLPDVTFSIIVIVPGAVTDLCFLVTAVLIMHGSLSRPLTQ